MGRIVIISATSHKNLTLAKNIKLILNELGSESEVLNLEEVDLPLYTPIKYGPKDKIDALSEKFKNSEGFIFCSPEYNGGVAPILSNVLSWISVTTDGWRDGFCGKFALICTHSGGSGWRFLAAFRSQLEHLGTNVLARTISVSNHKPLNGDSAKLILKELLDHV